jgi:hypothetical protein
MEGSKISKEQQLGMRDKGKGVMRLKYIFERDDQKRQIKLMVYCSAFMVSELEEDVLVYGSNT